MNWLLIAIGGAIGSMARYASTTYVAPLIFKPTESSVQFPWGTFAVNLLGSFLIGLLYVVLVEKNNLSPLYKLFFITGLLGGYTTFSAFSLEMLQLWQSGQMLNAISYAVGSVVCGLLLAFGGMLFAQKIF